MPCLVLFLNEQEKLIFQNTNKWTKFSDSGLWKLQQVHQRNWHHTNNEERFPTDGRPNGETNHKYECHYSTEFNYKRFNESETSYYFSFLLFSAYFFIVKWYVEICSTEISILFIFVSGNVVALLYTK